MGPRDGPAKGASVKSAKALPRVPASQISEMIALLKNVKIYRDKQVAMRRTRCLSKALQQKFRPVNGK